MTHLYKHERLLPLLCMLPGEHKTKPFSNEAKVLACKQDFQLDYSRAAAQTLVGETMKRD